MRQRRRNVCIRHEGTMTTYDAVVVGLGVTGAASLYRLAKRGLRVMGVEQFSPTHDRGSSHGETRIIRLGYFEHPSYVPLLREAYPLWRDLEAESGQKLLTITGIVEIGHPEGELVRGTRDSSKQHGLPHGVLSASALRQKFPAFAVPTDYVGVYQPDGGYLAAEPAVSAMIDRAVATGAEIRTDTTVENVAPHGNGVRIRTSTGDIDAHRAVIAAGPWLASLMPERRLPLRVTRQVLGWLSPPSPATFGPEQFPVFLFESPLGVHYGFPIHNGSGLKLAKHHHHDETVDPSNYDRAISRTDQQALLGFRDAYLPAASGPLTKTQTCLYTMTPDGHFIIDRLPNAPQIVVASPCSGHGFKFAPVIGEIVADLTIDGATQRDISRFALARFG
jgi:sarcosine oxidase